MHSAEGTVGLDAGILEGHLHVPRLRIGAAPGQHGLPNGPRPTTQVSRWRGSRWWGQLGFLSIVCFPQFAAEFMTGTDRNGWQDEEKSGSEHGKTIRFFCLSVQHYSHRPCS